MSDADRIIGASAIAAFLGIGEAALAKRMQNGRYQGVIRRSPVSRRLWAVTEDLAAAKAAEDTDARAAVSDEEESDEG